MKLKTLPVKRLCAVSKIEKFVAFAIYLKTLIPLALRVPSAFHIPAISNLLAWPRDWVK